MTRAAQKTEELLYLGEFLRYQYRLHAIVISPALKEPPDGTATITNVDATKLLLDFEVAEYFVDNPVDGDGGSPSKRANGFWEKVTAEAVPPSDIPRNLGRLGAAVPGRCDGRRAAVRTARPPGS